MENMVVNSESAWAQAGKSCLPRCWRVLSASDSRYPVNSLESRLLLKYAMTHERQCLQALISADFVPLCLRSSGISLSALSRALPTARYASLYPNESEEPCPTEKSQSKPSLKRHKSTGSEIEKPNHASSRADSDAELIASSAPLSIDALVDNIIPQELKLENIIEARGEGGERFARAGERRENARSPTGSSDSGEIADVMIADSPATSKKRANPLQRGFSKLLNVSTWRNKSKGEGEASGIQEEGSGSASPRGTHTTKRRALKFEDPLPIAQGENASGVDEAWFKMKEPKQFKIPGFCRSGRWRVMSEINLLVSTMSVYCNNERLTCIGAYVVRKMCFLDGDTNNEDSIRSRFANSPIVTVLLDALTHFKKSAQTVASVLVALGNLALSNLLACQIGDRGLTLIFNAIQRHRANPKVVEYGTFLLLNVCDARVEYKKKLRSIGIHQFIVKELSRFVKSIQPNSHHPAIIAQETTPYTTQKQSRRAQKWRSENEKVNSGAEIPFNSPNQSLSSLPCFDTASTQTMSSQSTTNKDGKRCRTESSSSASGSHSASSSTSNYTKQSSQASNEASRDDEAGNVRPPQGTSALNLPIPFPSPSLPASQVATPRSTSSSNTLAKPLPMTSQARVLASLKPVIDLHHLLRDICEYGENEYSSHTDKHSESPREGSSYGDVGQEEEGGEIEEEDSASESSEESAEESEEEEEQVSSKEEDKDEKTCKWILKKRPQFVQLEYDLSHHRNADMAMLRRLLDLLSVLGADYDILKSDLAIKTTKLLGNLIIALYGCPWAPVDTLLSSAFRALVVIYEWDVTARDSRYNDVLVRSLLLLSGAFVKAQITLRYMASCFLVIFSLIWKSWSVNILHKRLIKVISASLKQEIVFGGQKQEISHRVLLRRQTSYLMGNSGRPGGTVTSSNSRSVAIPSAAMLGDLAREHYELREFIRGTGVLQLLRTLRDQDETEGGYEEDERLRLADILDEFEDNPLLRGRHRARQELQLQLQQEDQSDEDGDAQQGEEIDAH